MYSLSDGKTIDQGMRDEKGQEKKYFSNDVFYSYFLNMFRPLHFAGPEELPVKNDIFL